MSTDPFYHTIAPVTMVFLAKYPKQITVRISQITRTVIYLFRNGMVTAA